MANIRSLEGFGYIIRLTIKYNDIGITINLIKENNNKILVLLKVINGKHDYPNDINVYLEAWSFFKRQINIK